jgi:hypothetical protein
MNVEQEIDVLRRQMKSLRRQLQATEEWLDTIASPWWKKAWWLACGWRWYRVGRWYGKE